MSFARWWLRRAAKRLVAHGWPVTPGAYLANGRFDCGRPGCPTITCHPALERWEEVACHNGDHISGWWRHTPHSVLMPTGYAFDVLEVPAPLGAAALGRDRGPVASTPTGRWMLLVQPGKALPPELAHRCDLVRHGLGSWIPAPPTRLPEGPVRWIVSPQEVSWQLPEAYPVHQRLTATLRELASAPADDGFAGQRRTFTAPTLRAC